MTKQEAKAKAKDVLLRAIGYAYYRISDDDSIPEEEQRLIIDYINKYGQSACKAFGEEYVTF